MSVPINSSLGESRDPITSEELERRGWDGASRCRCLAEGEGYVPCPPQMCDAQALLEECRDLSRLHRIAMALLTDEQLSKYRQRRDAE